MESSSGSNKVQHYFFLILLIVVTAAILFMWWPFLTPLVLAASLGIVFQSLFDKLSNWFGGRTGLASAITVIIILVVVLVPLVFISSLLFGEAKNLYVEIAAGTSGTGHLAIFTTGLEHKLKVIAPNINLNVNQYFQGGLQWVVGHLDTFFSSFFSILLNTILTIMALFFFLKDGRKLRDWLSNLSPLGREHNHEIFIKISRAVKSVVRGSLFISVIQGLFAGVGYAIFGAPNPVIWAIMAMILSILPGIGTSIVTIPIIIFLFFTLSPLHAIGLAIWYIFGIILIDNMLSPNVLKRGMKIHSFLILISVLGGIIVLGPIGFIIGPVTLALFFSLLDLYPVITK